MNRRRQMALVQGVYFAATGVWPLVHMPSFEAVTGPKTDKWLVRTVGLLVGVIGGTLVGAALRNRVTPEIAGLGVGAAASLGAIDTIYASRGRIAPVYFLDAILESLILAGWSGPGRRARRRDGRVPMDQASVWP